MNVLATGGTGFIGSHLIERLLELRAEVFALVRDPGRASFAKEASVHLLKGDLFDIPALPSNLDCVYHLAGLTKSLKAADYYTVNQRGTASLFDALTRQRQFPKVVVLSSISAGGPSDGSSGRRESDPPAPVTAYGKSKLRGEEEALARRDRFPVTILRVGAVYGPRDTDFLNFFKFLKRGLMPVIGIDPRLVSLCYVKDIVRALELAGGALLDSGEILNISDPVPHTMEDIGRAAARALGKRVKKIVVPKSIALGASFIQELLSAVTGKPHIVNRDKVQEYLQAGWVADVENARLKLSFVTGFSLDEGIRETIRWYQDAGWL
ncbi:MAG: NAD(P)-dependent oxidoreductase [Candidatus Aminicenantes bacterium]|nr:NAD(P)-dependent oxidoreductase [Candidatus Aminicenantes bacterium]